MVAGRRRSKCQPSSRIGENPPYGMIGRDRGNVGIIRSPVRASTLPDCGGRAMKRTSLPLHRREFITLLGGAAAAWPLAARAQQGERMRRIGVLMPRAADDPEVQARIAAFLQGLQQLGWTDGRNVRIDYRWAAGDAADIRRYAAELVALAPDVILATGSRDRGAVAAGDPHRADRVRGRRRSGRRRLCR